MYTGQLGGAIGPLRDPVTGQNLSANVQGRFGYQCGGDANAILPQLQNALLQATNQVIQQKLAQNQVALPTLSQSLPHFVNEIIQTSGVANMGVQITGLELQVQVQQGAAIQQYQGAMPPDPYQQTANRMEQIAEQRLNPENYEVRAQVNIGGFKLKGNSKDGFDTDGLANQAMDKAKTEVIWFIIGGVIVFLVVVGLIGLGIYVWYQVKKGGTGTTGKTESGEVEKKEAKTADWDGKKPFVCTGSDHVTIKGVTSKLDKGVAVTANGSCVVDLEDVDITAPICLQANGSAVINVKGGSVNGKDAAAKALGSAKIKFSGTKVTGKKDAIGTGAKVEGP